MVTYLVCNIVILNIIIFLNNFKLLYGLIIIIDYNKFKNLFRIIIYFNSYYIIIIKSFQYITNIK